jgi:hypothetical protein
MTVPAANLDTHGALPGRPEPFEMESKRNLTATSHNAAVRSFTTTMNTPNISTRYPVLPGEQVYTADDGTVTLICRNGTSMRFTRQEWETYNADFMANLCTSDIIETMIATVARTPKVDHDYVIDMLLDLRARALKDERVRNDMVRIWTRSCNELRWFALHGVAPDEPMPENWTPVCCLEHSDEDGADNNSDDDMWDVDDNFPF